MSKSVLIVDDEPDQRSLMREILEIFGFDVMTAANGQEALDLLISEVAPGVIVLDITMPVMSGREFLRVLHSGRYPNLEKIPVIVVSAVSDFADLQESYNCIALIRKPMHIETLRMFAQQFAS